MDTRNRAFIFGIFSPRSKDTTHTSFVFLLSGKRKIRPEHAERLNRGLKLQGDEEKYLRLMIKSRSAETSAERAECEAIREYHRQVLDLATRALEEQNVSERVFNSCTMTIDSRRLDEAKELILQFRSDLAKLMEKDGGDETYQLRLQLFILWDNSLVQELNSRKNSMRNKILSKEIRSRLTLDHGVFSISRF